MVLLATGWSGAVGGLGVLALRRRRSRSVGSTLVAVAVIGVAALVAGVVAAARAMFISSHDLGVVVEVALVAAAVTLLLALLAVRDVVRDVETVRRRARALGGAGAAADPSSPSTPSSPPRLRELGEIADELGRAAERLAAAREREQTLEASRRELVSWVSHDLRTPLAGIRAMAEALEDGLARDPAGYHRQIRREVDRLSGLVDDLFELSRIQSGVMTLHAAAVDLRELAHDAVAAHVATADRRAVALTPVSAPPAAVPVHADRAALTRALTNLVGNAVRYSSSPGTVTVHVATDGRWATVDVLDTCGGIPADHRARVFEPGWRAETARTPGSGPGSGPGGGLGLAIAAGLVHAHGGDLTVHDAPGGCRFSLRLPTADPT